MSRLLRGYPYALAGSVCIGLAAANAVRAGSVVVVVLAVGAAVGAAVAGDVVVRVVLLALALALGGWWWGSARLDALDASALAPRVGESDVALVEVTGPARHGSFAMRIPAKALRFGSLRVHEPVLLELPLGRGVGGERRAVLEGIVLGEDQGLSDGLRTSFRSSGLYHLLAVSGQNVALIAGGVLALAWLLGVPRWLGELGALAGIGSYVLAVGAQPSVIRAGIAGALGSLAWLTARQRDRWHFLLVGALVLLAWNPYALLDAGFQLSFAAVVAIFLAVPRLQRTFEGYPVPRALADVVSISLACGVITAPVLWLQFGRIPVYSVPANALAAPVVAPLLGLGLATAIVAPISTAAASVLAGLNGWLAAYLAGCARLVGGLPGATVSSGRGLAALAAVAAAAALALRAVRLREGR